MLNVTLQNGNTLRHRFDYHQPHVFTVKILVAPVGTAFGLPAEPSFHLVASPMSQIPRSSLAASALSPTKMGKHVEAADTMKYMKRSESDQQALSRCKFIQMQKGVPSFVQAQCTISWLHIGDKIASTCLVSHLTFISKLCGWFNISRQKKLKTQELRNPLMNWGKLNEIQKWSVGKCRQRRATPVAPRVEIPTKSLRSKLQGTAMLQHRFQGHLLGWWRWCEITGWVFGWWPVDPWKIWKFIEWTFGDMFGDMFKRLLEIIVSIHFIIFRSSLSEFQHISGWQLKKNNTPLP